ncbi:AIM24 family protein [Paenibacillus cremeus]|uniref:AIM24 family protein n=1 Tax=Paenibacillus cremeus TaxID=2163881 RepID=A0A559K6Y6_9BACL|nr:AIM24 family protein [Paenibacillus cremeus]TVY07890.1 AIM24 family protein [Paenibacillus cremeus]
MIFKIDGDSIQHLSIELNNQCKSVYCQSGNLIYMTPNIRLLTNSTGRLSEMIKRVIAGNNPFINHFELISGTSGEVVFSTRFPSQIIPLQLSGKEIAVQQHSFLCAEEEVHLETQAGIKGTGLFGGNDVIYNKLSGQGTAFVAVEGELITKKLDHDECILVHPGHLTAYESSVRMELQRQIGIKNMFLSGEGVYFFKVTGPGEIMLNSISIHGVAEVVSSHLLL